MAIINGQRLSKKDKLKININSSLLEEIQAYCKWAKIEDISYFFEEAAYFIFSKDKEWKQLSKVSKKKQATKLPENS